MYVKLKSLYWQNYTERNHILHTNRPINEFKYKNKEVNNRVYQETKKNVLIFKIDLLFSWVALHVVSTMSFMFCATNKRMTKIFLLYWLHYSVYYERIFFFYTITFCDKWILVYSFKSENFMPKITKTK